MSMPWDILRRGSVLAVQTGGAADAPVLEEAGRLARVRGDGRVTRLGSHGLPPKPPAVAQDLRFQDVRRGGALAAAAAAQAVADGATWIVAPATLAVPLFRTSPCPLLLLPGDPAPPRGPVLVPVDFSRASAAAAAFAKDLGPDVRLAHAFRVSIGWHKLGCTYAEFAARLEARCREDMDALLGRLRPFAPESRVILGGDPAATILAELRRSGASSVVLAARRRSFAASWVPSVAERVAAGSPVPVWILRDERPVDFLDAVTR